MLYQNEISTNRDFMTKPDLPNLLALASSGWPMTDLGGKILTEGSWYISTSIKRKR